MIFLSRVYVLLICHVYLIPPFSRSIPDWTNDVPNYSWLEPNLRLKQTSLEFPNKLWNRQYFYMWFISMTKWQWPEIIIKWRRKNVKYSLWAEVFLQTSTKQIGEDFCWTVWNFLDFEVRSFNYFKFPKKKNTLKW